MSFQVGDTVRFKMGRGFSEGKIVKIEGSTATIQRKRGTLTSRQMDTLFEPKPKEEQKA